MSRVPIGHILFGAWSVGHQFSAVFVTHHHVGVGCINPHSGSVRLGHLGMIHVVVIGSTDRACQRAYQHLPRALAQALGPRADARVRSFRLTARTSGSFNGCQSEDGIAGVGHGSVSGGRVTGGFRSSRTVHAVKIVPMDDAPLSSLAHPLVNVTPG